MLKNLLKRKNGKILCLLALASFSLVSSVVSTVCWFSSIRNVTSKATNIRIVNKEESQHYTFSYRALKFDDDSKSGMEVEDSSTSLSLELDPFRSLVAEKNLYLSQLIEVKFNFNVVPTKGADVSFDIPVTQNYLTSSTSYVVASYMSNLVKFKTCLYSYKLDGSSTETYAFTVGNVNRYKKSIDGKDVAYSKVDDKLYQEVRYHLSNDTNYPYKTYANESTASTAAAIKDETSDDYKKALTSLNTNKTKTINVKVKAESSFTSSLPANCKEATVYIQCDYSSALINLYAKNNKVTLTKSSAKKAVTTDFSDISLKVDEK